MAESSNSSREFYLSSLDSAYFFIIGFTNVVGIAIPLLNIKDIPTTVVVILTVILFVLGAFLQVKAMVKNSIQERMKAWQVLFSNIGLVCLGLPVWTIFRLIPWNSLPVPLMLTAIYPSYYILALTGLVLLADFRDYAFEWLTRTMKRSLPKAKIRRARTVRLRIIDSVLWLRFIIAADAMSATVISALVFPDPYNLVTVAILVAIFLGVPMGNPKTFFQHIGKTWHNWRTETPD